MKKALLSGVLIAGLCSAAQAESNFFAGLNYNAFTVSSKNRTQVSTTATSTTRTSLGNSSDSGFAPGLNLGLYVDETKRINFQTFRGEDDDSAIFTADMTSLAFDYVFNAANPHSGVFLGAGLTYIRVESSGQISPSETVFSKVSNSTNFLFRGGYTYKFENNFMLELGLNFTIAEKEHKVVVISNTKKTTTTGDFTVNSFYLGANYVF